jgi:esterase
MKLFYRKYGEGSTAIIILHGLFGQCDNWQTMAKAMAGNGREVYTVDQRNHGLSPHSDIFNYQVMGEDLDELVSDLGLSKVILIGHSMGGKTAMQFAATHPGKIKALIVADIAPKQYAPHHGQIIQALQAIDFNRIKTRREAEASISGKIEDAATCQFLLKNLYWETDTRLGWRFNLEAIAQNDNETGKEIAFPRIYTNKDFPVLFMRGEKSSYVKDSDIPVIRSIFPDALFETVPSAGHWLHADNPKQFLEIVLNFI